MAFKVHKEREWIGGATAFEPTRPLPCVCQWYDLYSFYEAPGWPCCDPVQKE